MILDHHLDELFSVGVIAMIMVVELNELNTVWTIQGINSRRYINNDMDNNRKQTEKTAQPSFVSQSCKGKENESVHPISLSSSILTHIFSFDFQNSFRVRPGSSVKRRSESESEFEMQKEIKYLSRLHRVNHL